MDEKNITKTSGKLWNHPTLFRWDGAPWRSPVPRAWATHDTRFEATVSDDLTRTSLGAESYFFQIANVKLLYGIGNLIYCPPNALY